MLYRGGKKSDIFLPSFWGLLPFRRLCTLNMKNHAHFIFTLLVNNVSICVNLWRNRT